MAIINIFELLSKKIDVNNILCNEPMKKHTSFKVGGVADFYVIASSIEEIKWVFEISNTYNIPVIVVGNGTNLLVLDGGIRGIVLKPNLKNIEIIDNIVKAGAGVPLSLLCKKAQESSLSGLEFAYGIPGTVGGAIRMNAGAYGGEIKDVVLKTMCMHRDKQNGFKVYERVGAENEFTYRNSIFSQVNDIVLEATFTLEKVQNERRNRE